MVSALVQDIKLQDIKHSRREALRMPIRTCLPKQWESALLWLYKPRFFSSTIDLHHSRYTNIALQWVLSAQCWPEWNSPCFSHVDIPLWVQEFVSGCQVFFWQLPSLNSLLNLFLSTHPCYVFMWNHKISMEISPAIPEVWSGSQNLSCYWLECNAAFSDCSFSKSVCLVLQSLQRASLCCFWEVKWCRQASGSELEVFGPFLKKETCDPMVWKGMGPSRPAPLPSIWKMKYI